MAITFPSKIEASSPRLLEGYAVSQALRAYGRQMLAWDVFKVCRVALNN